MTESDDRAEQVRAFMEQWRRDQSAGIQRELGEYLRQFPGDDDGIARAYLRHRHRHAQDRDETTIGPYKTSKELGRGGQGIVFRARHSELGHDVALKVLQGLGPGSGQLLERFYREAKVAARLNHPGICQVVDAGIEDGIPFMAMQYVEGETLDQRLKRAQGSTSATEATEFLNLDDSGAPPEGSERQTTSTSVGRDEIDRILALFEKAARALHVAHEAGVVHRDVKPANIMVRPDGEPVLLDFGLAHSEDDDLQTLTATGDFFGTPAYMSPEQLAAQRIRIDARTDIWSLGIALFECLALRRPFEAPTRDALYQAIMTREAPSLRKLAPNVRKDLAVVVAKAIEKDRERRYSTAEEFAEELRRVRELQPIVARPVGPWTRTARWAQRNPVVAGLLTTVILVLSTSIVLTTREARRTEDALGRMTEARNAEKDERVRKEEALLEFQRLADTRLVSRALETVQTLWPIHPRLEAQILAWKEQHAHLLSPQTLRDHEQALARLRKTAQPYSQADRERDFATEFEERRQLDKELAAIEAMSGIRRVFQASRLEEIRSRIEELAQITRGQRTWTFTSNDDAFRHDVLEDLVGDLTELQGEGPESVRKKLEVRLARARRMAQLTSSSTAMQGLWDATRSRIRNNERYRIAPKVRDQLGRIGAPPELHDASGFMTLKPQIGLIPLGPDPQSGLEEFLHLDTHAHDWSHDDVALPTRRDVTSRDPRGGFKVGEKTGVILVLIPAGSFWMGSQSDSPSQPNHDPGHYPDEGPVQQVALGAFFIAKHEFTQGQWRRASSHVGVGASEPSANPAGELIGIPGTTPYFMTFAHPVENVSWQECDLLTRRVGLTLPTEAQWERAARAGKPSWIWSGASEVGQLSAFANISGKETTATGDGWDQTPEHEDPHVPHAPVGSFRANGFGLHDMSGNIFEHCLDGGAESYAEAPANGNGLRQGDGGEHAARGGSFNFDARYARVAMRLNSGPTVNDFALGFRAARPIDI